MPDEPDQQETIKRDRFGRYVPGVSGNPKGRPPGLVTIVGLLKQQLEEDASAAPAIVRNWITLARDGDHQALRAILSIVDRVDGPVLKDLAVVGTLHQKIVDLREDPVDAEPER